MCVLPRQPDSASSTRRTLEKAAVLLHASRRRVSYAHHYLCIHCTRALHPWRRSPRVVSPAISSGSSATTRWQWSGRAPDDAVRPTPVHSRPRPPRVRLQSNTKLYACNSYRCGSRTHVMAFVVALKATCTPHVRRGIHDWHDINATAMVTI